MTYMRRNESAAAALQNHNTHDTSIHSTNQHTNLNNLGTSYLNARRNKSFTALNDLNAAETRAGATTPGSRAQVCDAVAAYIDNLIQQGSTVAAQRGGAHAAHAANAAAAAGSAAPAEAKARVDGISTYIATICKQLDLPNSCIVAVLIYVERLVAHEKFELTALNWQPSVLAGFVVAAKLCFDEPVWNEDFVSALRISNVTVAQISKWEANFLQLIQFHTNVVLADYAKACFRLQQTFLAARGERVPFFTFLMLKAEELAEKEKSAG